MRKRGRKNDPHKYKNDDKYGTEMDTRKSEMARTNTQHTLALVLAHRQL